MLYEICSICNWTTWGDSVARNVVVPAHELYDITKKLNNSCENADYTVEAF